MTLFEEEQGKIEQKFSIIEQEKDDGQSDKLEENEINQGDLKSGLQLIENEEVNQKLIGVQDVGNELPFCEQRDN